jgi:hypothetical protein
MGQDRRLCVYRRVAGNRRTGIKTGDISALIEEITIIVDAISKEEEKSIYIQNRLFFS